MVALGCDYYESQESIVEHERAGLPRIGIGTNCRIENTIVDKNARIGRGVHITGKKAEENYAGHGYMVREGITVIEKDAVIPDGAII